MNIADTYTLAQQDIANFAANLKNSAIYEDDGRLFLVDREMLNGRINELISERKFGGSSELIKYAKSGFENTDMFSAETFPESVNVPFSSYYKLLIIAEREDVSLDDILRRLTIPKLKSSLEDIKQLPDVDRNKVERLDGILKEWGNKRNGSDCAMNLISVDDQRCYGENKKYSTELSREITSKLTYQIDTMFMKHLEMLLSTVFSKQKLPDTIAGLYVDSGRFLRSPVALFGVNEDSLNFSLYIDYLLRNDVSFFKNLQDDILDRYGKEMLAKVYNAVDDYSLSHFLISFGSYGVNMNTGQLLIEGVDPLERSGFEKTVYDKLDRECSLRLCGKNKNESISLMDPDFDDDLYVQKLQSAISNGDYEAASMYSESLQIHQVLVELGPAICDILNEVMNAAREVRFEIPRTLRTMLDLVMDEQPFDVFIGEELDRYWDGEVGLG